MAPRRAFSCRIALRGGGWRRYAPPSWRDRIGSTPCAQPTTHHRLRRCTALRRCPVMSSERQRPKKGCDRRTLRLETTARHRSSRSFATESSQERTSQRSGMRSVTGQFRAIALLAKNAVTLTFIRVHDPMNLFRFFPTHSEQLHTGHPGPGLG